MAELATFTKLITLVAAPDWFWLDTILTRLYKVDGIDAVTIELNVVVIKMNNVDEQQHCAAMNSAYAILAACECRVAKFPIKKRKYQPVIRLPRADGTPRVWGYQSKR